MDPPGSDRWANDRRRRPFAGTEPYAVVADRPLGSAAMPSSSVSAPIIPVVLRWWDGRTTAYTHDAGRDGPLDREFSYADRGGAVGQFRFTRLRSGVFVFSQVH